MEAVVVLAAGDGQRVQLVAQAVEAVVVVPRQRLLEPEDAEPLELARDLDRKPQSPRAVSFEPRFDAFRPRNLWSLQNAFTGACKLLDPLPQARALSSIGEYFEALG